MARGSTRYKCEEDSPMYLKIIKERNKGYSFEPCNKTRKIIKVKI